MCIFQDIRKGTNSIDPGKISGEIFLDSKASCWKVCFECLVNLGLEATRCLYNWPMMYRAAVAIWGRRREGGGLSGPE